eukprot:TRINITY_DN8649_c0_g1_i6.p1 TRINITY_DN8649_c0_g1~~TRINITY_DN8649_c0_g1_i6.p1  ORF type:complete len:468 (-),score=106.68 TRINITY_DN8649_c0_g1_i6:1085-2488(-)
MFCGVASCVLLAYFSSHVLRALHYAGQFLHLEVLQSHIRWLMIQPAGMKLNESLGHAFGNLVLFILDLWNGLTTFVTPFEPYIVLGVGTSGIAGVSLMAALSSDLLSLCTLHVDLLHSTFSRIYSLALTALSALWKLFRGKKKNVLRSRIDSCDYDVDQLLLGTLLFALIVFLFPTVSMYYLFFSIVRLLVTIVQAALFCIIFFFNYFPFFSVGAYCFGGEKLPGGVWIEVLPDPSPLQSGSPRASPRPFSTSPSPSSPGISQSSSPVAAGSVSPPPASTLQRQFSFNSLMAASNDEVARKENKELDRDDYAARGDGVEARPIPRVSLEPFSAMTASPSQSSLASLADSDASEGSESQGLNRVMAFLRSHPINTSFKHSMSMSNLAKLPTTTYMLLHSCHVSLGALFFEYRRVLQQLGRHYTPVSIIGILARGQRYPDQPSLADDLDSLRAPSIFEFWLFIKVYLRF